MYKATLCYTKPLLHWPRDRRIFVDIWIHRRLTSYVWQCWVIWLMRTVPCTPKKHLLLAEKHKFIKMGCSQNTQSSTSSKYPQIRLATCMSEILSALSPFTVTEGFPYYLLSTLHLPRQIIVFLLLTNNFSSKLSTTTWTSPDSGSQLWRMKESRALSTLIVS